MMPTTNLGTTRFTLNQKVGEGTYGEVYKGFDHLLNEPVAVKKIRASCSGDGIASTELREISILNNLEHENIVCLRDVVFPDQHKMLLVFECCDNDLRALLKRTTLSRRMLKSLFLQLLRGIRHCHANRVVHRDLKPQNLLVCNNDRTLKIADFGLARAFQMPMPAYTHEVVTLWYRAPEILLGESCYQAGVDTWSCGCILSEMATGQALFPGDCEVDELFRIFRAVGTPTEQSWPGVTALPHYKPVFPMWAGTPAASLCAPLDAVGLDLMSQLLVCDPERRASAKMALEHPWFEDAHTVSMP